MNPHTHMIHDGLMMGLKCFGYQSDTKAEFGITAPLVQRITSALQSDGGVKCFPASGNVLGLRGRRVKLIKQQTEEDLEAPGLSA